MNFHFFQNNQGSSLVNATKAKLLSQGRIMIPPAKVKTLLEGYDYYLLAFDPDLKKVKVIFSGKSIEGDFKFFKVTKHGNGSIYIGNLTKIFESFNFSYEEVKRTGIPLNSEIFVEENKVHIDFNLSNILFKNSGANNEG